MCRKTVTVSAPGKVILFGEHAINALSCAIDLRTYITIAGTNDNCIELNLINLSYSCKLPKKLTSEQLEKYDVPRHAITSVLSIVTLLSSIFPEEHDFEGLYIMAKSDIPIGAGLGSSAAFSVALVSAIWLFRNGFLDLDRINDLAMKSERLFHGNPSGLDHYTSMFGGLVWATGRHFESFGSKMSRDLVILIINTKISRSTKNVVQKVKSLEDQDSIFFHSLITDISRITDQAKSTLTADTHNFGHLSGLILENQVCLERLGVSNNLITQICAELWYELEIPCKITGAGDGGCLIVFPFYGSIKPVSSIVNKYISEAEIFEIRVSETGIIIEQ